MNQSSGNMKKSSSYGEKLKQQLDDIESLMFKLIDKSEIKRRKEVRGVIGFPKYYWEQENQEQEYLKIKLKKRLKSLIEHTGLFFSDATTGIEKKIKILNEFLLKWGELESRYDLPSNKNKAKVKFGEKIEEYKKLISIITQNSEQKTIIVPDTNVIAKLSRLQDFRKYTDKEDFDVIVTPTVLLELDELKIKNIENNFKNDVKAAIKRIKGLRKQGSLLKGVTVDKTITFKMLPNEPNFENTLSWLDRKNKDDRIIASLLEIQRENPSSQIFLVTADINLENKAEMANIPYIEVDLF